VGLFVGYCRGGRRRPDGSERSLPLEMSGKTSTVTPTTEGEEGRARILVPARRLIFLSRIEPGKAKSKQETDTKSLEDEKLTHALELGLLRAGSQN
jgi:hypothetical protein